MSRRSHRRARRRLARNQRIRHRGRPSLARGGVIRCDLYEFPQLVDVGSACYFPVPTALRAQLGRLEDELDRAYRTTDRLASLGLDVRDEHDELDMIALALDRLNAGGRAARAGVVGEAS